MKKRVCFIFLVLMALETVAQTEFPTNGSNDEFKVTTLMDFRPQNGTNQLRSSGTPNTGYEQLLKNNTPISPQAAAIERNATYSMDYSTGVPNISIPLYEIKVGDYTLPISISYHASGIKVQDMATPVGLGWVLNAGGVVNRQVRGTTDYITNSELDLSYSSESEIAYDMAYNTAMSNYLWHRLAMKGEGDTESDRYSFSFNGKSSVFRYCVTDNSLRTIPYSGMKIEHLSSDGFKITDTDGTKYYFEEGETNTDYNSSTLQAVTTWYITKIEPATNKHPIQFSYISGKTFTQDYITQMDNTGRSYELREADTYPGSSLYTLQENIYYSDFFQSYSGSYHGTKLLSQISWAGNIITFNYVSDRKERNWQLDRLSNIVVKDYNGSTIRTILFDNDHYLGSSNLNYRMLLNGVTIQGTSSSDVQTYAFGYTTTPLPNYFNTTYDIYCHEDYWGYYNGGNFQRWIPSSLYSAANSSSNNRTPSEYYAKAGSLTSITFPTGGSTELVLESNVTYDGRYWGGLRLKTLTDKDAAGNVLSTKTYEYGNGIPAREMTEDIFSYDVDYYYGYRDTGGLQWGAGTHTIKPSSPILSLTGDIERPIYYENVTEYVNGLGKTTYCFTECRSDLHNMQDNEHIYDPLRLYSEEYNFDRGHVSILLTSKANYAQNGSSYTLKSSENYTYAEIERDTFRLGVRFEESNVLINYGGIGEWDGILDYSPFHHEFCYSDVWAVPSFFILTKKEVTDYDHKVKTTTSYGYDSQFRTLEPTSETQTVSNGDALTTRYTYPFEKSGSVYTNMANQNMQIPVETQTLRAGVQIAKTQTAYSNFSNLYLPSAYYIGKGSSTPELRMQYDYDTYGNLAYAVKDGTEKTVFLWGYNGQYPVAKIEGMTKSAVYSALGSLVSTLLGNPTSTNIYSVNTNSTLANSALVTTYTWNPLVGMTSMRKPNLETAYYTYDTMGRLASVKNHNQRIVENYLYNYGATESSNYVRTRTMTNPNGTTYRDTYDYYDGLGRKTETVGKGLSPNGSDLVALTEYDGLNRPTKEWLPTTFSNTGSYVAPSTYRSASRTYYNNDSKPYCLTEYENGPSDKVLKRYGPGALWQDGERAIETLYTGNNANDVRIYAATNDDSGLTCSGFYAANQLFVVQTKDENQNYSYTFTDKEGRLVLERCLVGSEKYDTYYVYDIYGNLAFVLPPAASDALTSGTWNISTNSTLQDFAYNYRYDSRNRCIEKKLPGCEEITMTYDNADRLVTEQDGVRRASNLSTYYEYDDFGRQTVMGTKTSAGVKTQLLVNYYDNYDFTSAATGLALNASNGADAAFPYNSAPNARGLLTGIRASDLAAPSTYFYTSYYYGERERLVQSHSQNFIGGFDDVYYTYNFSGTVASKKLTHTAYGTTLSNTELYTNTYDSGDRLTNVTHKLNSNAAVTLTVNTYDAVGRLLTKKPMNTETVTYAYNVRNWLTGISSTHFTESLAYNAANGSLSPSVTRWGGNIGAMSWKAGNESSTRTYQFSYNALDWLTAAAYTGAGNYNTEYTYDKMGNFQTLKRYGLQDGGIYGLVDNLTFTLSGNQVTKIEDSVSDPTYNAAFNFVDGASQSDEYEYDENGNLTKDLNKNISSIQYNLLNLPQTILFTNQRVVNYGYDVTGRKFREVYVNPNSVYFLCNNMTYQGNTAKQVLIDGGYITLSGSTPVYHYYLQDHLGNNRVVCNASGTVEQVNHYYPFGGLFGESTNGDTQLYKYNGKEFERMHGLDWYDYGARYMDAMRFTTMDPLAEKYYNMSPYAYCGNNPIRYIDEHGDSISFTGIIQYGNALNVNISQSVISDWQTISGLSLSISENGNIIYAMDENGKPIVSTSQKNGKTIENGSQAARDLLTKTIDAKETITFQGGRSTANLPGTNMIGINLKQMTALINGTSKGLDNRTMGWGMTLLHEMLHTPINANLKDDRSSEYSTGPVVDYMNIIRTQLNNQGFNFGIRKQYMAFPYGNKYRIKFSKGQYVEF